MTHDDGEQLLTLCRARSITHQMKRQMTALIRQRLLLIFGERLVTAAAVPGIHPFLMITIRHSDDCKADIAAVPVSFVKPAIALAFARAVSIVFIELVLDCRACHRIFFWPNAIGCLLRRAGVINSECERQKSYCWWYDYLTAL